MAPTASKRDAQPRRRHGLGALGYAWLILITAVVGLAGWAQFFRDETEPTQFVAQIDLPPVASLPVPVPAPAVEAPLPVPPPIVEAPAPVPAPPPLAVVEKPVESPPAPAPEPKPAEVKPAEPPPPVVQAPTPEEPKAPAIALAPAPLPPPALVPERPIVTPGPPGPAPAPQAAPEPTPPPAPAPQAAKPAPSKPAAPPSQTGQSPAPGQQAAAVRPPAPTRDAGQPPWIRYALPFDANDRRPRIAIVISELGLSSAATDVAIQQMPSQVTLAFSPYAENLAQWINLARAAGHEVLINLPMEPLNFPANDPGPQTLLTSLSEQQNLERLSWALNRVTGYVGVSNHMGSRFTAVPEALKPVLQAINTRGLMFLDTRQTPRSVAIKLAAEIGLPRAFNNRSLDQEASRVAIDARLGEIEKLARENGAAVAVGSPYPVTFERVLGWLPSLEAKGIALAPISAVANRQGDR
ncbi:MAG TPA: divergent polysaccharide deacetylase family protein [Stellaceae bacterium]|jgi:hypothetical protein|nr:divergent polysaccharide deacetylase family protein [Stellaceae bacterium]